MDALHDREVPPVSILRHIRPAFALFARQVLRSGRPPALDYVPDFPLRCQHCEEPLRFVTIPERPDGSHLDSPSFRAPDGSCCCRPGIPHKPMPSVLG